MLLVLIAFAIDLKWFSDEMNAMESQEEQFTSSVGFPLKEYERNKLYYSELLDNSNPLAEIHAIAKYKTIMIFFDSNYEQQDRNKVESKLNQELSKYKLGSESSRLDLTDKCFLSQIDFPLAARDLKTTCSHVFSLWIQSVCSLLERCLDNDL